jgi:PAS domain S-box-containing protein
VPEASVYGTALLLTLANLFFFEWVPLTRSHFPGLAVSRPAEFLPGAFFLVAFFGYLAKGSWRRDAFEHWLLIFLLISTMTHIGFMALSRTRFDAMFDAAHALKIASYLAILTGLLYSVYLTFRREAQVLGALTGANEALAREVDVRARTEQAVKEGRSRLQDFLDNANDLIQSVAPDGKVLYVNSAWKRVLGYTDEQLARLKLRELVHPAHRENLQGEFERVLDGGDARRFNVEYLAADGRTVILSGSVQAQRVRGEPVATQGIFRDVTEQRLAERQLAESRANLAALVENTGDSIWSIDRQHRLITFNSAFSLAMEARSGMEPSVGQSPRQTFPREDLPWYEEVYARALSGERHVALRTDEVDGQTRYFELYANPIQGEGGITGAVFFGKDVTPRVRAEEALRIAKEEAEAANKAKSDFLANMSHELRTPLNSVIGFTNILRKNKDEHLTEKDLGFLNRVLANGKHLLELINEVLDLAKVEAGRMELVIEEVDLGDLVTETVMQLEGQAKVKEGDVSLVAAVPEEIATVETDSAKLKQVIINLVGNALKFTHEGTVTVRVDVGPDGRTPTAIAVQDTGIGIPDDRLEAIFEAFQQAEAGTSRKYGGTGLGLAISRSICLLMGYDLIVESEVGTGSTFSIVMGERARRAGRRQEVPEGAAAFPPAREHAAEPSAEEGEGEDGEETRVGTHGRRPRRAVTTSAARLRDFQVLVVDDEKDSRVLMAHYLEDFGCEVVQAENGEDGLAAARLHDPDLITLDLMMPGMSGWEVLRRLKQDPELRHIPVVVVSIVAGEGRGRLLGAVDLVTKPFEREDLLRVLWRNLVRRRGGRILVADDDPVIRESLGSFLGRLGLETVMAEDGKEALDAIRTDAPDAVILDLAMPGMDGMTFLGKLRENPLHVGLPVLVLTGMEVTRRQHEELGDLASAVVQKGVGMQDELEDILGSYFRLAEGEPAAG